MLLLLFLIHLVQGPSSKAIPLSPFGTNDPILSLRDTFPLCSCPHPDQRSVWEILWSCLVVTFTCSWVSVHPDIPSPGESWKRSTLRRVEYMLWTVLTPELIIFWAARQYVGARKIAKEQHEHQWTKTHGHFLQMGGFMLFDGKQPKGVLAYSHFQQLLKKGRIEFPEVTVDEIKDRGKSDGLGKTLVIAQTGWFILQCISRRAQGLDLAEIELATLAFAALNGFMYFFWWNKPFDVHMSVPVRLLPTATPDAEDLTQADKDPKPDVNPKPDVDPKPEEDPKPEGDQQSNALGGLLPPDTHDRSLVPNEASKFDENQTENIVKFIGRRVDTLIFQHSDEVLKFEEHDVYASTEATAFMRVPTFYSTLVEDNNYGGMILALPFITAVFGAIHCAGWFFHFPSTAELWIWRISSLSITGLPLIIFMFEALALYIFGKENLGTLARFFGGILEFTATYVLFCVYIVARLALLGEAFAALRDPPPGAFQVVKWTSFIPHIS